jgi:hypothetical protein
VKTIWTGTFSYPAYHEVLETLKMDFPSNFLISEIPQILSQIHRPKLLIRHDLRNSLEKALDMARIEFDHNVRAAYMVPCDSKGIDLERPANLASLKKIKDLGHEIGLFMPAPKEPVASSIFERAVHQAGNRLSQRLGFPIFSVALAAPPPDLPEDSLFVGNKVNATAPIMMRWVLNDTDKIWEISDPKPAEEDPKRALIQVVVRPEAWGAGRR